MAQSQGGQAVSADDKAAAAWDDYIDQQQEEKIEELERQLNAANAKIQRLEEAGDALKTAGYFGGWADAVNKWVKVKEGKP